VFAIAARKGLEAVVFGGDLLPPPYRGADVLQCHIDFITMKLRPLLADFKERVGAEVYCMPGNDDAAACAEELEGMERDGLVRHLHMKQHCFGDLSIYGYSFVPLTPFGIKDWDRFDTADQPVPEIGSPPFVTARTGQRPVDIDRDIRPLGTIAEDFERIASETPADKTVYVTHAPPFNTALDILYSGEHIGSRAIRTFIERYQPPLTLHGHIHESASRSGAFYDRIGKTVSVNPGSSMRQVHAVIIDTADIEGSIRLV